MRVLFRSDASASAGRQWPARARADPGWAYAPVLLGRQNSRNLGLSATLSGPLAGGRAIFSASYGRLWANGRIDQPDLFSPEGYRTSHNRSVSENLSTRLTYNRSIARDRQSTRLNSSH